MADLFPEKTQLFDYALTVATSLMLSLEPQIA
jgi:hypothetical protein